jgi:hypothetical protein
MDLDKNNSIYYQVADGVQIRKDLGYLEEAVTKYSTLIYQDFNNNPLILSCKSFPQQPPPTPRHENIRAPAMTLDLPDRQSRMSSIFLDSVIRAA